MTANVNEIVLTLRQVAGHSPEDIGLHEPKFGGREWDYVKDCIDTGWVSSAGSYVGKFEAMLATRCGAVDAVAVVNGTAALHLALIVVGVRPGDEVIVPTLTFAATANAVSHAGAIPHLADSSEVTLGLDPIKLAQYLASKCLRTREGLLNASSGRRIAAIIPMHVFGHPVDMDDLASVAAEFAIPVVEDAAEALGSTYKDRAAGALGHVGVLSFNGNKVVTTGGGGALVSNDPALTRRARHIATTAKRPHRWAFEHDEVGYNYRMPNINAALGCAQLEQLDSFLKAKRRLAQRYIDAFTGIRGVSVFRESAFARSNYWLNTLVLDEADEVFRDQVLEATNRVGLMTRPVWRLMHRLPMYAGCPRMDLSIAEILEHRIINVPSSVRLGA